jgi:hypothetical protein
MLSGIMLLIGLGLVALFLFFLQEEHGYTDD